MKRPFSHGNLDFRKSARNFAEVSLRKISLFSVNFYLVHKIIGYLMVTELLFQRKDLLLDEFSEKSRKLNRGK
jgi:hypothetical protein